jgi:hypothetical protein
MSCQSNRPRLVVQSSSAHRTTITTSPIGRAFQSFARETDLTSPFLDACLCRPLPRPETLCLNDRSPSTVLHGQEPEACMAPSACRSRPDRREGIPESMEMAVMVPMCSWCGWYMTSHQPDDHHQGNGREECDAYPSRCLEGAGSTVVLPAGVWSRKTALRLRHNLQD